MRHCPHCNGDFPTEAFYGPTRCARSHSWCIQCCRKEARAKKHLIRTIDGPDSLYVAHNPRISGEIKIGRAKNPFMRLASLSQSQNFHIHLLKQWPGLGHLEPLLHAQFSEFRVRHTPGREWFALPPEDIGLVENCVDFLKSLESVREQLKKSVVLENATP